MAKILKCPGCGMEFSGETEEEVRKKMMEHGRTAHSKDKKE